MDDAKEICRKFNDFDHKFARLTERFVLSGQNCNTTVIDGSRLYILMLLKRAGT